ncbi:MAG: MFS transporter [Patescibacteria group bacterium]
MENTLNKLRGVKVFLTLFVATLLFSFSSYFIYFINSTYIETHVGTENVSYIFALGALLNVLIYSIAPTLLRRFGNFKLTIALTSATGLLLLGLAWISWTPAVLLIFIACQGIAPVIVYCIDIFLEKYTPPEEMGSIRGIYLTMVTIPAIVTPFIVGLILSRPDYWKLYLIAAVFLVPFIIIMVSNFRKFEDPYYPRLHIKEVLLKFYHHRNIFDVFVDNFLLNLFYCWMVIFMPLYLRETIGFAWSEIGLLFSIMLLPFLLLQIPVGRLADAHRDEKYLLIFGFLIIAGTSMIIPFIQERSFALWAAILFTSRIGASIVEVASESFFFKHVHANSTGFISLYRLTRSLPFIVTPLVSLLLIFIDLRFTFIILGLIMLLGIRYAIKIRPDGLPGHEKESISPFA